MIDKKESNMNIFNLNADLGQIIKHDGKGWVISGIEDALFELDFDCLTLRFIEAFDNSNDRWRRHFIAGVFNGLLVCLPDRGNSIVLYDTKKKNKIIIDMPYAASRWVLSHETVYLNNKLYMYSEAEKNILVLDFKAEKCTLVHNVEEDVKYARVAAGKFIFLCGKEPQFFCEYDVGNDHITRQKGYLPNLSVWDSFIYDGEYYWLSGIDKILIWNPINQILDDLDFSKYHIKQYIYNDDNKCVKLVQDLSDLQEEILSPLYLVEGKVWVVSLRTDSIFIVDKYKHEIEQIVYEGEDESEKEYNDRIGLLNSYKYSLDYIDDNGYLWIYSFKNRIHYVMDINGNFIKKIDGFELINKKEYYSSLLEYKRIIDENKDISLQEYIYGVV